MKLRSFLIGFALVLSISTVAMADRGDHEGGGGSGSTGGGSLASNQVNCLILSHSFEDASVDDFLEKQCKIPIESVTCVKHVPFTASVRNDIHAVCHIWITDGNLQP